MIKNKAFILLFIIVLLSRIPFLGNGYGVEEDSWGTAVSAWHMHDTGKYETSRLPGHPVQDYIYSLMWGCGSWWFNAATALMSSFAVFFFALALERTGMRHPVITALAFAFCPVVYISSCYTIDYMWAMAFAMASFYFLVKEKWWLCGILLAFAIGCRVTTGALLLPFLVYAYDPHRNVAFNLRRWIILGSATCATAILLFVPVVKTYGWNFMVYYDQFPPTLAKLIYKGSLGVFGTVGLVGLCITLLVAFLKRKSIRAFELYKKPGTVFKVLAVILAIVLYLVNYLQLPQKSAYLITAIPFLLIACSYCMNRVLFFALCFSFVVSSFVCSINLTDRYRGASHSRLALTFTVSGQEIFFDPVSGPVFSDYSKRKVKLDFTSEVMQKAAGIEQSTVIISGWFYNQLLVQQLSRPQNPRVTYIDYLSEAAMKDYRQKGYAILYLPEQESNNDVMFGVQHTSDYASPMFGQ